MSCKRMLLALVVFGLSALAVDATAADPVNSDSLLWRVTPSGNATPSYVFGTMHSDRAEVVNVPNKVESAFDEAKRYAFELDFGAGIQQKVAQEMLSTSSKPLKDELSDGSWGQLTKLAKERGLPPQALNQFEPWAVAMTFAMPKIRSQEALDWVLYQRAEDKGAPVSGLETVDEQLSVFQDIPRDKQFGLLETVLDMRAQGRIASLHEDSVEAWLNEDLARLVALAENNPMMPDPEAQAALQKRLVTERNTRMTKRMRPLIDKGGAFVAIGALHLPGDQGIIQQLKDADYQVEAVR